MKSIGFQWLCTNKQQAITWTYDAANINLIGVNFKFTRRVQNIECNIHEHDLQHIEEKWQRIPVKICRSDDISIGK